MPDLFSSVLSMGITIQIFLLCSAVSLALGCCIAFVCSRRTHSSQGFLLTLALLPMVVQMVIMMVNGNVGAGVAVAGAFNLVRFRSVPGSAREIASIFLSMAAGLATGMGYLGLAVVFVLIACLAVALLQQVYKGNAGCKSLRITIPESLNYGEIFDDLFATYTVSHQLVEVKTSNLGSLYKLHYHISLLDESREKEFLDALRCRNGNLEISCGMLADAQQL